MATESHTPLRRATLDAYWSLGEGDVLPLVALLDPKVEWTEPAGPDRPRSVLGSAPVAALLTERVGKGRVVELRGVAVEKNTLALSFSRPWWESRPRRLHTLIVRGLGGEFTQTLRFGRLIERIESSSTLINPKPSDEQESRDALATLLHRLRASPSPSPFGPQGRRR
jgi:hypothetical protein